MKLVDLTARWADDDAPETVCDGMLYQGQVHVLAGAPDTGKTTLALFWALQVIREGGTVLMLDEEGGSRIIRSRLKALGASQQEVSRIAYAPFPGRSAEQWDPGHRGDLKDLFGEHRPQLVLLDSAAAILATAGLDENSAADVSRLWACLTAMARGGCHPAVVIIDHLSKASDREADRYSRGSSAKLAAADVMYRLEAAEPFSRDQEGRLKLAVTKDREGCLTRFWRIRVRTGSVIAFEFELPGDDGRFQLTRYMSMCSEALARHQADGGSPIPKRWFDQQGIGRTAYVRRAVGDLITEGYLTAEGVSHGQPTYILSRPYGTENPGSVSRDHPCPTVTIEPCPVSTPLRGDTVHEGVDAEKRVPAETPISSFPVEDCAAAGGSRCQGCAGSARGTARLAAKPGASAPAEFALCDGCAGRLRQAGWVVEDAHRDASEAFGGDDSGAAAVPW